MFEKKNFKKLQKIHDTRENHEFRKSFGVTFFGSHHSTHMLISRSISIHYKVMEETSVRINVALSRPS